MARSRNPKPPPNPLGVHVRIYWQIIDSPAWRTLSYSSQALFVVLRRKLTSTNNGNINATLGELKHHGWKSPTTLVKALRELVACGFLAVTRQGGIAYGQKVCTLYRFTDEQAYAHPKQGIEASPATNDWQKLDTLNKAKAVIKNELGLQKMERDDTESVASTRFNATDSVEVAAPLLQNLMQSPQAESAAKPRQRSISAPPPISEPNGRTTTESVHLCITAIPTAQSADEPGGVAGAPAGKSRTRSAANLWPPERIAELRAYRQAHGLNAAAAHFGMSRQRVCKLLPGMGKRRGTFTGRKAPKHMQGSTPWEP